MSYIHLEFPGRELGSTKKPQGEVIYHTWRKKRYAHCKGVTAAFYNSGNHVYSLWDGTWPHQYEGWEQPLKWLHYPYSLRRRAHGIPLQNCSVKLDGHKWAKRNSPKNDIARIQVFTNHGNTFEIYLVPSRVYYIIDINNRAEAVFATNPPVMMPKSLLMGKFDRC